MSPRVLRLVLLCGLCLAPASLWAQSLGPSPGPYEEFHSGGAATQAPTTCQGALDEEALRHEQALLQIRTEQRRIQAEFDKKRIDCYADGACAQSAAREYQKKLNETYKQQIDENTRHTDTIDEIKTRCTRPQTGGLTLPPGGGTPGAPGGTGPSGGTPGHGVFKLRAEEDVALPDGGDVWPPLAALSDFVNNVAPHYDMTRPHEGLRVFRDILIDMGLGQLLNKAPVILQGLAGGGAEAALGGAGGAALRGTTGALGATASGVTKGTGGAVERAATAASEAGPGVARTWTPPPGASVPKILQSTPRPVYLQGKGNSCAIACTKAVVETVTRRSLPEAWYRQLARKWTGAFGDPSVYSPTSGTPLGSLPRLLDLGGVRNSGAVRTTLDQLADATKDGYPAIVGLGKQDAKGIVGHAVIVDGVVGSPGNRHVFVRDPFNPANVPDAKTRELLSREVQNYSVLTEQEFMAEFTRMGQLPNSGLGPGQGWAILTRP